MTHLELRGRWQQVLITDNPFKQVRVSPYAFAARRVRRRDEFEALSLLLAVLVVLFVLAVTMGAAPLT